MLSLDIQEHPQNKGKKIVIFFDTYEKLKDDEWIRELHREMQSALFVISGREPLPIDFAAELEGKQMENLNKEDAKDYLEKRGVKEEVNREKIYRHIGGHPFGLGLAAELYLENGGRISEEDLAGNRDNYRKLARRFLRHLNKNERDAIRLLSLYEWWDRDMFLELSGRFHLNLSVIDFNRMMRRSFIEEIEKGRYTMHDLMRRAIASQIPDEEIDEDLIQEAYTVAKDHFWKLAEFKNIKEIDDAKSRAAVEFVRYVVKSAWTEEEIEKCLELAESIAKRAYYEQSRNIYETLLGSRIPDKEKGRAFTGLGTIDYNLGNYSTAIEHYESALEKYGSGWSPEVSTLYAYLGNTYLEEGRYEEALKYYEKTLKKSPEYEEYDTAREEAYSGLGMFHDSRGDYDKALEYYEKALSIDLKIYGTEEHPGIATDYSNIGGVHYHRGDYDKALEYYEKALSIGLKIYGTEEHPDIATMYSNIGLVHYHRGDYDKALEYYEKALDITINTIGKSHPNTIAIAENMLWICEKTGNEECINRCREITGDEPDDEEKIIEYIAERLISGRTVDEVAQELMDAGVSKDTAYETVQSIKDAIEKE